MMAIDPKTAAVCAEASGFWLMKTEPSECSIDDTFAATNHAVSWFGVRNYQARNFMRDQMKVGDAVLFKLPQPRHRRHRAHRLETIS